MSQASYVLEARDLSKHYRLGEGSVSALTEVSLAFHPGEFLSVMGPSGSGKSTLLHLLGLLDAPSSGDIAIGGQDTAGLDDDELTRLRRDKLGFIFQSFELIPNLSAQENILLPAEVAGQVGRAKERLQDLARRLDIAERLHHRPKQLSGGQQQRVAIARALINHPCVILADEPTGNLDRQSGKDVLSLLRQGVDEESWTVVMVTHDPKAALIADRIILLRDGGVVDQLASSDANTSARIEAFLHS